MTPPVRRRTRAREVALQLLFQFDLRGERYEQEVGLDLAALVRQDSNGDEEVAVFAQRLVEGTLKVRNELDERLRSVTRNWDLKRMAAIDRNVLRMSMYELIHCNDVPPKVAINEYVEIAHAFYDQGEPTFVNSVLDRVARQERAAELAR